MDFGTKVDGDAFRVLEGAAKAAHGTIMAAVNQAAHTVQARAKINVHQKLNTTGQAKGTLSRSVTVLSEPNKLAAQIGPSVIYGRIHEFGGIIKPVKGEWLWFRLPGSQAISYRKAGTVKAGKVSDGKLIRVKSVTIPKRPYLQPALDDSQSEIKTIVETRVRGLLSNTGKILGG